MGQTLPAQVARIPAILLLGCVGCSDQDSTAPAKAPPELPGDPAAVIAQVIDAGHGFLAGREKMANAHVTLGLREDDPSPDQIILGSNRRMRITHGDGRIEIRLPEGAWRVIRGVGTRKIEGEALDSLDRLQTYLRATLLEPLYAADAVSVVEPDRFSLQTAEGTWELTLRLVETADSLVFLPDTLSDAGGELKFVSYLSTGVTNQPREVLFEGFGSRWFVLHNSDVVYEENIFTDPEAAISAEPVPVVLTTSSLSRGPTGVAVLKESPQGRALVFEDPGTWEERIASLNRNGKQLGAQGQESADLDFFFDRDGKRYLAMPFEMGRAGGAPFVALEKQQIERFPAQKVVVVYPVAGTLAQCEERAAVLLDAFVDEQGLQVIGPLRIIPEIAPSNGVPAEDHLQRLSVRFELPVR